MSETIWSYRTKVEFKLDNEEISGSQVELTITRAADVSTIDLIGSWTLIEQT